MANSAYQTALTGTETKIFTADSDGGPAMGFRAAADSTGTDDVKIRILGIHGASEYETLIKGEAAKEWWKRKSAFLGAITAVFAKASSSSAKINYGVIAK